MEETRIETQTSRTEEIARSNRYLETRNKALDIPRLMW
jgi:hypothetical protein